MMIEETHRRHQSAPASTQNLTFFRNHAGRICQVVVGPLVLLELQSADVSQGNQVGGARQDPGEEQGLCVRLLRILNLAGDGAGVVLKIEVPAKGTEVEAPSLVLLCPLPSRERATVNGIWGRKKYHESLTPGQSGKQ